MSKITQNKNELLVINISEENGSSRKFKTALHPCILWLKVLTGVDITRTKTNGEEKKNISIICLFFHGILMLLFNFACSASFNYYYLKQRVVFPQADIINGTSVLQPTNSYVNFLTVIFITAVEYTHTCGIHLCFVAMQSRFKELWKSLLIIEKVFKICSFTYSSIRRSLWIGLLVIIPLVRYWENIQLQQPQ